MTERVVRTPRAAIATWTLDLNGVETAVQVRRHPRARRTSLRLSADGACVIVVLPRRARLEEGLAIARAHAHWIRARLDAQSPRVPFAEGALLPVDGRTLIVRLVPGRRPVAIDGHQLLVGCPPESAADRIRAWLRAEAKRVILLRIAEKVERLPRQPARVGVRDTRSRWGSCSLRGHLSFSWRLILAPPSVLDYVVAHELAHLAHRGHDSAFWAAVGELSDEVASGRAWLRQHGRNLFRYG